MNFYAMKSGYIVNLDHVERITVDVGPYHVPPDESETADTALGVVGIVFHFTSRTTQTFRRGIDDDFADALWIHEKLKTRST